MSIPNKERIGKHLRAVECTQENLSGGGDGDGGDGDGVTTADPMIQCIPDYRPGIQLVTMETAHSVLSEKWLIMKIR